MWFGKFAAILSITSSLLSPFVFAGGNGEEEAKVADRAKPKFTQQQEALYQEVIFQLYTKLIAYFKFSPNNYNLENPYAYISKRPGGKQLLERLIIEIESLSEHERAIRVRNVNDTLEPQEAHELAKFAAVVLTTQYPGDLSRLSGSETQKIAEISSDFMRDIITSRKLFIEKVAGKLNNLGMANILVKIWNDSQRDEEFKSQFNTHEVRLNAHDRDIQEIQHLTKIPLLREVDHLFNASVKVQRFYNEVFKNFDVTLLVYMSLHTDKIAVNNGKTGLAAKVLGAVIGSLPASGPIAGAVEAGIGALKEHDRKSRINNAFKTFNPSTLHTVSQLVSLGLAKAYQAKLDQMTYADIDTKAVEAAKLMYHAVTSGSLLGLIESSANATEQDMADFLMEQVTGTPNFMEPCQGAPNSACCVIL